jgi:protein-disulfide isomerase
LGSLFGVCITAAVFYVREQVSRHLLSLRASATGEEIRDAVPVRPGESFIGDPAAPVTMIEYSDFQCPYCALFHARTFPKIKAKYIDSGQLRFIHRHLPLPAHRLAVTAAEAAACAGDQGLYWILTDLMFSRASCLECQGVVELSKAVPLDRGRFEECVSSERHRPEIDQDIAAAKALNLRGTPTFIVGRTTTTGVKGIAFEGARAFEEFESRIDRILGQPIAAAESRDRR